MIYGIAGAYTDIYSADNIIIDNYSVGWSGLGKQTKQILKDECFHIKWLSFMLGVREVCMLPGWDAKPVAKSFDGNL